MIINNDQPITSSYQDILGRKKFSERLAKGLASIPSDRGFTIALKGRWGIGKSSVIELTLEHLHHLEVTKIFENKGQGPELAEAVCKIGVAYNMHFKWLDDYFESEEKSARRTSRAFVLKKVSEKNNSDFSDEEIIDYFYKHQAVLSNPEITIFRFSPWLIPKYSGFVSSFISDLYVVISEHLGPDVASIARKYVDQVFAVAGATAEVLGQSGAGKALDSIKGFIGDRDKTLDELKQSLDQKLKGLNKKILIVIDDLDRMTPKEATKMIVLVKSLGQLPNIVYLLSYDEEVLVGQIQTALKYDEKRAQNYLEKIVQLQFELDEPRPFYLNQMLYDRLRLQSNLEMEAFQISSFFDENFEFLIADVWRYLLVEYLKTPRDIVRVINKFSFARASGYNDTTPIDLLVISIVEALDPELYQWIKLHKRRFTKGFDGNMSIIDITQASDIARRQKKDKLGPLENLKERTGSEIKIGILRKKTVEFLFPTFMNVRSNLIRKPDEHHAIENPDHVLNYFQLGAADEGWPRDLLKAIKEMKNMELRFNAIREFVESAPEQSRMRLRVQILDEIATWP